MDWPVSVQHARVAVLCGGESAEREISRQSGRCVAEALEDAGYSTELIDPALEDLQEVSWRQYDACFMALHGGAGEDGRIQQDLQRIGVPFTGSCPSACRLAMSKSATKERFWQGGVPTPRYVLFPTAPQYRHLPPREAEFARREREALPASLAELSYPLVIKPDSQGSSLGVRVAHDPSEFDACLAACRSLDTFAIAEPLIRGREFTVAVLDRQALPLLEIIKPGDIFDYTAKYESQATEYRFDTGLDAEMVAALEMYAVQAADCLGTAGLCRVDLMLDHAGNPWFLEINAVPGMTEHSLAPMAARRAGLDMPQLCHLLVQKCLASEPLHERR